MNFKWIIESYGEYLERISHKFQDILTEQNGAFILLVEVSESNRYVCRFCEFAGNVPYDLKREINEKVNGSLIPGNLDWLKTLTEPRVLNKDQVQSYFPELNQVEVMQIIPIYVDKNSKNIMIIGYFQDLTPSSISFNVNELQNYLYIEQFYNLIFEIIIMFNRVIEEKEPLIRGHMERVVEYADLIAGEIGREETQRLILQIAGAVHDVGKIMVPDFILQHIGKYTEEMRQKMQKHSEFGYELLKNLPMFNEVAEVILYHHEHYDGQGYPKGLKGNEIPLYSRILAIADSFDAMVSERVYKVSMGYDEALEELVNNKGKQFDPELVEAFIAGFRKTRLLNPLKYKVPDLPKLFCRVTLAVGNQYFDGRVSYRLENSQKVFIKLYQTLSFDMKEAYEKPLTLYFQDKGMSAYVRGHMQFYNVYNQTLIFEVKENPGFVVPEQFVSLPISRGGLLVSGSNNIPILIVELGGNGLRFVVNKAKLKEVGLVLKENTRVTILFGLKVEEEEQYFGFKGTIIETPKTSLNESYLVKFEDVDEKHRDRLISTLLKYQISLRRRGLL
ncbi:HD-GYP domain-containing protein [Carboxydothermus hydrogenoformans]|uniref:HDIG domain protein n=1 Tax=Carboxydothermus hydrogenoformans (strain ATCC BAA-161 / DSM 6008 / Z-2901) TaxID=246194 RepID=Q3ADN0_CARHZ|nr:HD-GYP domain-containing protein [Carboxydothermus hydrogenoformans]ABB15305.1 HDIG domain protein [Carboxydothermus hydrogenoformans Z-2901]